MSRRTKNTCKSLEKALNKRKNLVKKQKNKFSQKILPKDINYVINSKDKVQYKPQRKDD